MKSFVVRMDDLVTRRIVALPAWWRTPAHVGTIIGHPHAVGSLAFIIAISATITGNASLLGRAVLVGIVLGVCTLIKQLLRRPRPATGIGIKSYSFPSTHAAGALVAAGLLATVAAPFTGAYDCAVSTVLMTIALCIGVSRVLVGAHYPSDVLGGWLIGGLGLIALLAL